MTPRNDPASSSSTRPTLSRLQSSSKASLMSHPSFEADDERSSIDADLEMSTPRSDVAQYEDEDTRPTSQKELAGWYSYGWASEVFVICAMGSFLPITLEQLARDRGVLLSDKTTPCPASWKTPQSSAIFTAAPRESAAPCVVYILGMEVNTASFAMYTFSISVLVQSLLIVSMSGAADHGRFRKTFLLSFAVIGAVAMMLFLAVISKLYLLGALLAVISNTCFGASFVLLNSFLPLLVRYHPSVRQVHQGEFAAGLYRDDPRDFPPSFAAEDDDEDDRMANSSTTLLTRDRPDSTSPTKPYPAAVSRELSLSTKISAYGISIGYTAGLLVQLIAIITVSTTSSTTFSLRLVLFIIGSWWLVFTIPAALWLRPRPGPPLPAALVGSSNGFAYIKYAWKALFKTIGRARKLKDIMIFLAAWFLLSDSIATISGTAVLFGKTNLSMKVEALALINVIATVFGVIGALCWSSFSRIFNLRASQTIVACICLFEVLPIYGCLGFIPAVKRLGYLGLQQPIEMYFLGAVYGFILGGLSSYCRSFFGELIPPGFEASFYSLYAITDKGSSIFGPAIVGLITDRYGDIRPAFVFLAVLIFLPLPLMLLVDVDRGKEAARAMVAELQGQHGSTDDEHVSGPVPQITLTED